VTQLREQLGCEVTLDNVFEYPTPEALALQVTQKIRNDAPTPSQAEPGKGQLGEGRVVLSLGQKRFWTLSQLDHAKSAYNLPFAVQLQGPLNLDALRLALSALLITDCP